jgi:hypothetical protein
MPSLALTTPIWVLMQCIIIPELKIERITSEKLEKDKIYLLFNNEG